MTSGKIHYFYIIIQKITYDKPLELLIPFDITPIQCIQSWALYPNSLDALLKSSKDRSICCVNVWGPISLSSLVVIPIQKFLFLQFNGQMRITNKVFLGAILIQIKICTYQRAHHKSEMHINFRTKGALLQLYSPQSCFIMSIKASQMMFQKS